MRGYDEYSPEQETALDASVAPYRSPQEAYYKRQHQRTRRYSSGNEMNRNLHRTYSEDHKYSGQSVHSRDVYQVCPDYGPPDTRYYGSTPRRSRRMCPDEYYYDPRGMCCCEEEWYSRNRHHYYANDIPPCPPAPAAAVSQSSVVVYSPQDANDPRIAVTQEELFHTKPYKHRPMSRSSSRELKANGLGNAPYSQRQSRREDSESEDDIIALNSVPMSAECRCSCDRLVNGSYRQLKEEDSTHFPPDVTQGSKEEVTFYPRHPASTASTSTTSAGCMMVTELLGLARCRQRWLVIGAVLLAAAAGLGVPLALRIQAGASYEERLAMANKLLQDVPLIDGHNDLPWNIRKFVHNRLSEFTFSEDLRQKPPWSNSPWSHTDLLRLRAGHVSAQFWAAYVPCESQFKDAVQLTLEQIDVIKRFTAKYSPPLTFCTSASEISTAHAAGQLCSLIGVEGGHSLANSLPVLRILYSLGVRYLTLTSTCNTQWADSSLVELPGRKPQHGGLTNFGKIIVKEMNRLGMIVDLSHVSLTTMKAALEVSKAPVVFSHSSARALCNSSRNVPDNILATLGLNGGLVMVNFYSQFLTCRDTATIEDAAAHINHIRNIAGVDSVGLGAGYDGINFTPKGLEDVSTYPALFAELIKTGEWEIEDLKKLAGLNFLRVLQAVEKVRDDMAKSGVEPYEDTISPRYLKGKSNCTSQDPF